MPPACRDSNLSRVVVFWFLVLILKTVTSRLKGLNAPTWLRLQLPRQTAMPLAEHRTAGEIDP